MDSRVPLGCRECILISAGNFRWHIGGDISDEIPRFEDGIHDDLISKFEGITLLTHS